MTADEPVEGLDRSCGRPHCPGEAEGDSGFCFAHAPSPSVPVEGREQPSREPRIGPRTRELLTAALAERDATIRELRADIETRAMYVSALHAVHDRTRARNSTSAKPMSPLSLLI